MEQPKKYIKVSINERLPIPFKVVIIITDLDELGNGYCSENNNWWLHSKSDGKVTHWLDTVPDRESELIEMLERVTNKAQMDIQLYQEAKELIQSVKQPK